MKPKKQSMMFTTGKLCAFSDADLTKGVWVQASPMGTFNHPVYGEQTVDETRIDRFITHFNEGVYGQELPINYEHFGMDPAKGFKAAGWVNDMERREDGMWWEIKFTDEAATEIHSGEWKYFSPEWYLSWTHPESLTTYTDVASGGALTNQPFYKGMVPLNFSELATEVASLPATNEVADWEHSEPGSGPTPRPDNDDDTDAQGDRGTSPTLEPDPDAYDVEDSMEEFLKKLGELLKLEGEPTEEAVLAAFSAKLDEAQPIVDALEDAKDKQAFSERYPAEFQKMQDYEARIRKADAQAFAEKYSTARVVRVTKEGEEEKREDTPFGFSALAIEKIKNMHQAFSSNELTEEHLSDVLDAVLTNGMVDFSERGTARVEDHTLDTPDDVKAAFSQKVVEIVREDQISHPAAVRVASEKYPELARRYAEATKTK